MPRPVLGVGAGDSGDRRRDLLPLAGLCRGFGGQNRRGLLAPGVLMVLVLVEVSDRRTESVSIAARLVSIARLPLAFSASVAGSGCPASPA